MASRLLTVVSLLLLLLLVVVVSTHTDNNNNNEVDMDVEEEEEDLSFLEELEMDHHHHNHDHEELESDAEYSDNDEDFDDFEVPSVEEEEEEKTDDVEKDVVVLTDGNFSDFVEENKYVMVEFYAPWCGHCKSLAPEYAAAATALTADNVNVNVNVNVKLAKVDATEENELADKYEVQGFPTLLFFVHGEHKPYTGQLTKDAIVSWIRKKIGPGVSNITTPEDAELILTSENKLVLGFLDSLMGPDSKELAAASKLDDDINFYQTANPQVAKMFHLETDSKRPALVLLKKEAEKVTFFDGQFKKLGIAEFVSANKLPLVTTFSRESASLIFESSIKKQILLFATSKNSEKVIPVFQEAAKVFKGKLIFVYVEVDNEEVGKPVADYFGVTGDSPTILGYAGSDDGKKYILGGEVSLEKIKAFGEDFLVDKLKPVYKSDPIPETNDGDVKIVVGNNFDDIVLDESKDVLLEIYAPWCGHCQALEPTYNKLAKHLRHAESLVVAKMDGTTNEHPKAKADGFPTILFFPAGNKTSDPISVHTERTVVALYKFLKKNASIPFKLQKTISTPASENSNAEEGITNFPSDVKDEL